MEKLPQSITATSATHYSAAFVLTCTAIITDVIQALHAP